MGREGAKMAMVSGRLSAAQIQLALVFVGERYYPSTRYVFRILEEQ